MRSVKLLDYWSPEGGAVSDGWGRQLSDADTGAQNYLTHFFPHIFPFYEFPPCELNIISQSRKGELHLGI